MLELFLDLLGSWCVLRGRTSAAKVAGGGVAYLSRESRPNCNSQVAVVLGEVFLEFFRDALLYESSMPDRT